MRRGGIGWRVVSGAWWAALVLGACSTSSQRICDPGGMQRCPCSGGSEGVQVCDDDGARWGACDCGGADAGGDTGADVDGDAGGEPGDLGDAGDARSDLDAGHDDAAAEGDGDAFDGTDVPADAAPDGEPDVEEAVDVPDTVDVDVLSEAGDEVDAEVPVDADVREDSADSPDVREDGRVEADGDGGVDADAGDGDGGCFSEMGGPCNAVLQCGCGGGERCVIEGTAETCIPAGTDPTGTACGAIDHCVPQDECFGVGSAGTECMQFCYDDFDCADGTTCEYALSGIPGYMLCSLLPVSCDPFTGDGCGSGEACLVAPPSGALSCVPAGTSRPGDRCESEPCAAGSGCYAVPPYTEFYCLQYCDPAGGAPDCSALPGTVCTAALGSATAGVCVSG